MAAKYTGHVDPGGPPSVRRVASGISPSDSGLREIRKLSVGPMDNNAYLLVTTTGEAVLVDAANDTARLLDLVRDVQVTHIVTTHRHADHWQSLADLAEATGAITVAHRDDAHAIGADIDMTVGHGDSIRTGGIQLDVIHLRGHTPGSIALAFRGPDRVHLFTGDSLFPGGVGNTFGDADAFATLIEDVQRRTFDRLPDETWVYPGHGDDTTLGAERPHLQEWRTRGW